MYMCAYSNTIAALLRDWWGDDPSDFKFFVPIKWTVGFSVKNYEIFVPTNRYNWMDISPRQMENCEKLLVSTSSDNIS